MLEDLLQLLWIERLQHAIDPQRTACQRAARFLAGKDDEVLQKWMRAVRSDAKRRRWAIAEYCSGAQRMAATFQLEQASAPGYELDSEPGE